MNLLASAVAVTWKRNRDYALRLVSDVSDQDMTRQPRGLADNPRMNHPAWVLAHLNVYAPIAASMLRGLPFADPVDHRYGQKSEVSPDPAEYPSRAALIEEFTRLHDDAGEALAESTDAILASPTPLERWRAQHPLTGQMLVTLMVKHESFHLGQLSAWRRAMGLPRVAM